ncbi:MAG: hypothetical protein LBS56_06780 [Propionibacteriaceae bacterium]|jgi:hypothetical protein|nr:hypothetical protein [Propionibacteriaceae bacterium]
MKTNMNPGYDEADSLLTNTLTDLAQILAADPDDPEERWAWTTADRIAFAQAYATLALAEELRELRRRMFPPKPDTFIPQRIR